MFGRRSGQPAVAGRVGAIAVAVLLLAGCGSTAPTARSTPTPSGFDAPGAQVGSTNGSVGVFLVDGQGRTLYMTNADPMGTSGCYDACATAWPPLATTSPPTATGGAVQKQLSTAVRTDGTTQVLYAGHPLYTYSQDAAPGQTTGQGLNQQGGMWWVVGVDGAPIQTSTEASVAATSG